MDRDYIERRDTGLYIQGTRVPIDRIVQEYRSGEDAETIQSHYPILSIEQISGAIAYYLHHKREVEQVMEQRALAEAAYAASHPTPPDIRAKFERMLREIASRPAER
jgi:uncharacterized protein (DUF433 family)